MPSISLKRFFRVRTCLTMALALACLSLVATGTRAAAAAGSSEDAQPAETKTAEQTAAEKAAEEARQAEEAKKAEAARKAEEARLAQEAKLKAEADARAAAKALSDRFESVLRVKISRTPEDVFRAVRRLNADSAAASVEQTAAEDERYLLFIQAGEWEKLRDLIAAYPKDFALRIYGKTLHDVLYSNPRSLMLPNDVLRLADASPFELDDYQASLIGRLLTYAVSKTEARTELTAQLKRGTARLGGTDPARRHAAARVLASAEFWKEAKEFGLKENDIPSIAADAKAGSPGKLVEDAWNLLLVRLRDPSQVAENRDEALDSLYQTMLQSTPQIVEARLGALLRDAAHRDLAWDVVELIGRKTARAQDSVDFDVRRLNLELQETVMRLLAATPLRDAASRDSGSPDNAAGGVPALGPSTLATQPARTFANLYARNWLAESQFTLTTYPHWKNTPLDQRARYQHVLIEEMLQPAPKGTWLSVLEPQLSSAVKLAIARITLLSDNVERLLPQLAECAARDKPTAAELANAYLVRWAQLHDPNFTPEALRQYKLDGHAIVLTRAEQEQTLRQLGAALVKLDAETRKLVDEALLVTAFDLCHSKAEPYTRDQIVQVFGPMETMPPSLLFSLLDRMRRKLALNWRDLSVQRDAATKRDSDDVFELVNEGYAEGERIVNEWLRTHPDDWRMNCTGGSLLSDWAEFAYFQAVVAGNDEDRFAVYLKRGAEAVDRFRTGAKTYAAAVPKMNREEFDLLPYKAWFYGLLGITHDSGINLRKGVARDQLQEIRRSLQSLPDGAASVHLAMFSTMVADNVKANLIAPEMKYRYLSSAVEITGRTGTIYPALEKVQFYESLLKEIRLRARLDGDDRIRQGGAFGVFVTLVHTSELARESGGFGKYLQNETRRTVSGRTIVEQPLYRDRFEEALRSALSEFFEIKAIVFADPNAGAREMVSDAGGVVAPGNAAVGNGAAAKPNADPALRNWQETPLAYLHLVAKDATVDRVPPLEIDLDFFDRDGKVVIPVPSNPLLIEIAAAAPARRAAAEIAIDQIVDARELAEHKRLKIDVVATAHGLVPDLYELLDLQGFELKVLNVDDREGLHVSELHSGDDGLYAMSERNWTLELDPAPLLRGAQVNFQFPKPQSSEIAVKYRTYQDMDPVDAAAQITLLEGAAAAELARPNYVAWTLGGLALLLVPGAVVFQMWRKKPEVGSARPPAFVMPREATPFAVASLLYRIRSSPEATLTDLQRSELHREIVLLERTAFAAETSSQTTRELAALADRWIRTALPAAGNGDRPHQPGRPATADRR